MFKEQRGKQQQSEFAVNVHVFVSTVGVSGGQACLQVSICLKLLVQKDTKKETKGGVADTSKESLSRSPPSDGEVTANSDESPLCH